MKKLAIASVIGISTGLVGGCTVIDKSYDTVRDDMSTLKSDISKNRSVKKSVVEDSSDIWLGGDVFKVSESTSAPGILLKQAEFKQIEPVTVGELITLLNIDLGIKVILTQDAAEFTSGQVDGTQSSGIPDAGSQPFEANIFASQVNYMPGGDVRFTLNYKGTVAGLLDVIASKTGLFWRFENGEIVFKRNETRTYVVDITPGKTEYTAEMKSDLSASTGEGSSDSVHTVKQEIKPEGSWVTLEKSIQSILSSGGRLSVSESMGSITVSDTPQVQNRVEQFVKSINAIASKQIAVRADVYEINSDENGNFDTNIMALYDWKGDLNIGLDGDKLTFGVGSNDRATDNRFSDTTSASLNLLRNNKNASLVTSSTIYAMNGQPTPFQQLDEVGYLERIEVTSTSDAEPTVSLTPGKTSQGFSMMILPRIMSDGRVMMNFAVDSSRINSIDEYGTESTGMIQLPNRTTNKYNQLVTVRSGQPLMIAGLERTENSANIKSMFGRKSWILNGSQAGGKRKMMTMIILTPYIMQK